MENDGDSNSDSSNPGMVMEDNSTQLVRDFDSATCASSTEVAKAGPRVATFHGSSES